uniref:Uncharacterized protein n=1 Tax=Lygus hesperus TaxID=30085 RepID=A0A146LWJ0_LYGHE
MEVDKDHDDHPMLGIRQPTFMYKREMSDVEPTPGGGDVPADLEGAPDGKSKTDKNSSGVDGSENSSEGEQIVKLLGRRRSSRIPSLAVTLQQTNTRSCCFVKGLDGLKVVQIILLLMILVLSGFFVVISLTKS